MSDLDKIPNALKSGPQWVLWMSISRNGETTKVPFSTSGAAAKSNDPATWATFDEAVAKFSNGGGYAGVGYMFSADDPFVGIDLDGCRNPETGEISEWAADQIAALDTYAEVSPSGTGVKAWVVGKSPLPSGKKKQLTNEPVICDKLPAIELYDRGRFFCVTGERLEGPAEPQERQVQLDNLAKRHWGKAETNGHVLTVQPATSIVERARKYLAKIPPAVSGQGGHDATFHAACVLCLGFNLGVDDAYGLLSEWNQGCQPPWNERELRHKLDDAMKQPGERGTLLVGDGPFVMPGRQSEPVDSDRFEIRRLSSAEFDAGDFTTSYLVENVLAEGQPLVIAAQLKTMKTTLAVALAIALALGRSFLGNFWVREAVNVLLLSGESGLSTLQSAGRRIAASYGLALSDVGRLYWSTDLPRLGTFEHLEALREAITRDEIAVLICDPLYFMLPGADAGNLMIVGGYLRTLSALCDELGVTLVVVHHIRKTGIDNKHEPAELSHISWSGTAEWARQWLLLSRRRDYVPGTGEHRLWMVTGGSAGHSGLHALDIFESVGDARTWRVDVLSADEAREDERDAKAKAKEAKRLEQLEKDKAAILDIVVKLPEQTGTKNEIKECVGRNSDAFRSAFAALVNDGVLIPCEVRRANNHPYQGYRLKNDAK